MKYGALTTIKKNNGHASIQFTHNNNNNEEVDRIKVSAL